MPGPETASQFCPSRWDTVSRRGSIGKMRPGLSEGLRPGKLNDKPAVHSLLTERKKRFRHGERISGVGAAKKQHAGIQKTHPVLKLQSGMQFPQGAPLGSCIPEFARIVGHGFRKGVV